MATVVSRLAPAHALMHHYHIVDAHHHLWQLDAVHYPWLEARGQQRFFGDPTPIQRDYLPADFQADWAGLPIDACVHVQVGAADGLRETRWLDEVARMCGIPSALVAFADLTADDFAQQVEAQLSASVLVRGVRQIIGRHPTEDHGTRSAQLLDHPRFLPALEQLAKRGLTFDLQLTSATWARAADVLSEVPSLKVALCHAGSPWDQTPAGMRSWRAALKRFAALPELSVKLSGLGMFAHDWRPETLAPVVAGLFETFPADRIMWGSNFPVDKLYRSYRALFEAVESLVPEESRRHVFGATARRFYRLS